MDCQPCQSPLCWPKALLTLQVYLRRGNTTVLNLTNISWLGTNYCIPRTEKTLKYKREQADSIVTQFLTPALTKGFQTTFGRPSFQNNWCIKTFSLLKSIKHGRELSCNTHCS